MEDIVALRLKKGLQFLISGVISLVFENMLHIVINKLFEHNLDLDFPRFRSRRSLRAAVR